MCFPSYSSFVLHKKTSQIILTHQFQLLPKLRQVKKEDGEEQKSQAHYMIKASVFLRKAGKQRPTATNWDPFASFFVGDRGERGSLIRTTEFDEAENNTFLQFLFWTPVPFIVVIFDKDRDLLGNFEHDPCFGAFCTRSVHLR